MNKTQIAYRNNKYDLHNKPTFTWSDISKAVGWEGSPMPIPNREHIEDIKNRLEFRETSFIMMVELLGYHRYCKSPINDLQRETMELITKLVFDFRYKLDHQHE